MVLSRSGSVLAHKRKSTSLVLCTSQSSSTTKMYLENIICPIPHNPCITLNFPELVDMTLPPEGVFHNLVFVSIRKQYPYQAFKVMHGLWGMGQMMFSKYILVVDEDCDVHNTSEVLFRLCANTDPERDSTIIRNPSDSLDHAPTEQNIGSHMGIDATRKLPGENYHRPWPELLKMDERVQAIVDSLRKNQG